MSDVEERKIGGLTIRIDRLICVGFGDCIEPGVGAFALDEDGIAVFLPGADAVDEAALIAACRACPVDALVVIGPNGEQIHP